MRVRELLEGAGISLISGKMYMSKSMAEAKRILDATVLLPDECPDCRGSGEVRANDEERFTEDGSHREWTEDCPTCKGTGGKVWVVPKEQWEAFVCALNVAVRNHGPDGSDELSEWEVAQHAHAIATALLGDKVYRAKAIGKLIDLGGPAVVHNLDGTPSLLSEGTWLAILEKEDGHVL